MNDRYWTDVVEFIKKHLKEGEKLIAPVEFEEKFPAIVYSYSNAIAGGFQWAIIHKGLMNELDFDILKYVTNKFIPVFANEVFVVFSDRRELNLVSPNSPHLKSFWEKTPIINFKNMINRIKKQIVLTGLKNKYKIRRLPILHRFAKKIYYKLTAINTDIAVSQTANKVDYSSLSIEEIKKLMDKRYAKNSAYIATCLWDKVRGPEIGKHAIRMISPTEGKRILELGCGVGGNAPLIKDCKEYIGTELSEIALERARESFGKKPNFKFIPMDAMDLKFDNNQFDIVIATEVIEHLPNAQKMLKESFRVLKPGGKLLISSPNRDSLHLRVNRMLGYADFKCSIDHVKEYSYSEMVNMLTNEGFRIQDTAGVFLQPYWGIPKIDEHVRHLTDNDPEMVEMLRRLGELVGAEYAFCYVILAVKP
ncbi:MAG: class I SAM-dependent methyltransferase [Thermodesulfovibrionales bacterium]